MTEITLNDDVKKFIEETVKSSLFQYVDSFFRSKVALDSFAINMFSCAARTMSNVIEKSSNRSPLLVVLNDYVEGSLKVTFDKETKNITLYNAVYENDNPNSVSWELYELDDAAKDSIKTILFAHTVDLDKEYYLIDDIRLETLIKEKSSGLSLNNILKFNTPGQ